MDYIRAAEILPPELVEELQQYADGAVIYIPKKEEDKKAWGRGPQRRKNWRGGMRRSIQIFRPGNPSKSWRMNIFLPRKASRGSYGRKDQKDKHHIRVCLKTISCKQWFVRRDFRTHSLCSPPGI